MLPSPLRHSYGSTKEEREHLESKAEDAAHGLIRSEAVSAGTRYTQERVEELKKLVAKGDYSLHTALILLGPAMCASGVLSLLGSLLNPLHLLVELYVVAAGVVSLALETSAYPENGTLNRLKIGAVRKVVMAEARVLTTLTGRSGFYFVLSTLLLAQQATLLDLLIGLYGLFLSIGMFVMGRQAAGKLKHLRSSMTDEAELRAKFAQFDTDRDGRLSSAELATLCADLGSMLSHAELEGAIKLLDTNGDGHIERDEFVAWWTGSGFEEKILTMGKAHSEA